MDEVSPQLVIDVTEDEVFKAVRKLKTDKSPGPDNVHPMILHEAANELAKPLTIILIIWF